MREKQIRKKLNNLIHYFSIVSFLFFLFLGFTGCSTPGAVPDTDYSTRSSQEPHTQTDIENVQNQKSNDITDVDEDMSTDFDSTEEPIIESEILDEQLADQEINDLDEPIEYIPTEDLFISTFTRVEEIIRELNGIIQARDFNRWVQFLTHEYRAQLSSPSYLQEVSRRPILANRSIVLTSLEDYFLQVVVPSRANLRLDDLVFINEQKVQAFMIFGETKVSLYQLVYLEGDWKIGEF